LLRKEISEIPCRVSSDPHEWYNDVETVLTIYSAKMQVSWRCDVPATRRKDPVKLYYNLTLVHCFTCLA